VKEREYLTNQSFSAAILALCALSSARARDGALYSDALNPESFENLLAELYFTAAKEVIQGEKNMMPPREGLDWMRACALLALYGIQIGKESIAYHYLGVYHNLVSIHGLHDEKNWPNHIGIVETELRRRLVSFTVLYLE
jgi:Fungal specific transcription factor domain